MLCQWVLGAGPGQKGCGGASIRRGQVASAHMVPFACVVRSGCQVHLAQRAAAFLWEEQQGDHEAGLFFFKYPG